MMKTKDEILKTIQQGESNFVEFKEEEVHPDSLAKTMVAFSNSEGGAILIGIADDGTIKGIAKKDAAEWVINISRTNCIPSIEPQ